MTATTLFLATAAGLIGIGLYGLLVCPHPLRKVLAANVMSTGVLLALIALARRDPDRIDPVPQALVLTGIVIAVSITAFALALLKRLPADDGVSRQAVPDEGNEPSGTDSA
jgi:multicomponent Na+:H+ antiporter subunit C